MTDHNENDYDYGRIASELRLSTISILLYMLAFMAVIVAAAMPSLADVPRVMANLLALGAIIFSVVCIFRLAKLLHYGRGTIALLALCIFCPLLGIVPLITVYYRASRIVGYWKALFFRADGKMTDEFFGLILGLALAIPVIGLIFLSFWAG